MAQHCSFAMSTTRVRGSYVSTQREHGATHVATDACFEDVFVFVFVADCNLSERIEEEMGEFGVLHYCLLFDVQSLSGF